MPAGALDGDVVTLHFRGRSFGGVYGELAYPVQVIAANVVTADTFLASTDPSLDDASLVVASGTLTIEGPHTFRDLVVLDGATVTHPATATSSEERLEVSLTRDLFVACGGAVDAAGKGYAGGYGLGLSSADAAASGVGGAHGGRGGNADGSSAVYGNLFDPRYPGGGGGGASGRAGGGVIRIAAAGNAVIDGQVSAAGTSLPPALPTAPVARSGSTRPPSQGSEASTRPVAALRARRNRRAAAGGSRSTAARSRTPW